MTTLSSTEQGPDQESSREGIAIDTLEQILFEIVEESNMPPAAKGIGDTGPVHAPLETLSGSMVAVDRRACRLFGGLSEG